MAKWYGQIGYAESVEVAPGDWREKITARHYFGDTIRNTRMLQNAAQINDNVNIGNQISIVADPYAKDHIYDMRYAEFQGAKWKITTVDVQPPRLILSLGGLYNGGE
jgi:hypothetical protein